MQIYRLALQAPPGNGAGAKAMNRWPPITFGMIVLNGEPFIRYNLKALYPFAHQIVVVEGAASAAAGISSPDGHSTDGTLETLRNFKANDDRQDKLVIVTAEDEGHPNGFWPGEKHEQSQAYASRADGDYLWQVDVDEFYQPDDMAFVLDKLSSQPEISAVSFQTLTFWGGFDYIADGWYLHSGSEIYHRLFKWGEGYTYATHRPPTVHDDLGRNLRSLHWITGPELARQGKTMYHYSLVFPKQVLDKCTYYSQAQWATHARNALLWAQRSFFELKDPFRVHNVYDYPSWLARYEGSHPPEIEALRQHLAEQRLDIAMRETHDIECLLDSPSYALGRSLLKALARWAHLWDYEWPPYRARANWYLSLPIRMLRKGQRTIRDLLGSFM
jgi:hypothetical protein